MNCKSVESRLSAYIDRELGGDELLEIRAHLSCCPACREEAEGLKSLKMLLGSVPCPEPPDGLCDRLTVNMLRERYEEPRRTLRASFAMFAGIAACSMLVTLFVTSFWLRPSSVPVLQGQDSPVAAGQSSGNVIDQADGGVPFISVANYGPR
jgi:anti-sigma factor RsiW